MRAETLLFSLSELKYNKTAGNWHQNANYPNIRYFEVPKEYEFSAPRDTLSGGQWLKVDENSTYQKE